MTLTDSRSVNQPGAAAMACPSEFAELVARDGHAPTTTSRIVAERFGKAHHHVLRDIRKLLASQDIGQFNASNFGLVEFTDAKGQRRPEYVMTKDGFALLAMGFNGPDALRWKVRFIGAFNAMAEQAQARHDSLWQQMAALEARDQGSRVRASFGSRLMLARRREIPAIVSERTRLQAAMQPQLIEGGAR